MARWETLNDPAGMAAALGLLAEARMFQGRWEDAVGFARRALEIAGYPEQTAGIAYALWAGARALCRLGDTQTALVWTEDSARISQELGNAEGVLEARLVQVDRNRAGLAADEGRPAHASGGTEGGSRGPGTGGLQPPRG